MGAGGRAGGCAGAELAWGGVLRMPGPAVPGPFVSVGAGGVRPVTTGFRPRRPRPAVRPLLPVGAARSLADGTPNG